MASWRTPTLGLLGLAATVLAKGHDDDGEIEQSELENRGIAYRLILVWGAVLVPIIAFYIGVKIVRYLRLITCLDKVKQTHFMYPSISYARLKTHFIDAPLFRTRHHREFRLSSALNVGTLPSRIQSLWLVGYCAINVAFSLMWIDYSQKSDDLLDELRDRTGMLSVMNMVPLFLLAGRNNPLIRICGISFDTFNLLHRWIGRIVVLEAVAHTAFFFRSMVVEAGWSALWSAIMESDLLRSGFIGTVAFTAIFLQAPSIVRHAFYETFLGVHIALAAVALGACWLHCRSMVWQITINTTIVVWVAERLVRLILIVYRSVGNGGSTAEVSVLPGDAVHVKLRLARPWTFQPGQHIYLYIPSIGLWTSHPFTLSWSESESAATSQLATYSSDKVLPLSSTDAFPSADASPSKTTMSLLIRRRTGFTDSLYTKAARQPDGRLLTRCLVEGPYGGNSLRSYGSVVLFAAGIGITQQVPHVRDLVLAFAADTCATRRLTLVWTIQSPEHLEWIRPWMTSILALPRRRDILKILLFVTRPRSTREIQSPSQSVQMHPGRPNVADVLQKEVEGRVGAMAVSVCGTGSLADDVRRACRKRMLRGNIEFVEHAFSW